MSETDFSFVNLLRKKAGNDDEVIKQVLTRWSSAQKTQLKKELNENQIDSTHSGYDGDPFQQRVRKILEEVFGVNF